MTLNELYDIAEKDDIRVDDFCLSDDTTSIAVHFDNIYGIALDCSRLKTNAAIKSSLAHELGHCETHSFYNVQNYYDVKSRHEYRADKWAVKMLLPKDELERAFERGYVEIYELSEYFGVTEELVKKAMWIYYDKYF
jgi:abortive infection bacteriophage resistance protein